MPKPEPEWIVVIDNYSDRVLEVQRKILGPNLKPATYNNSSEYVVRAYYTDEAEYLALALYFADKAKKTREVNDAINHAPLNAART